MSQKKQIRNQSATKITVVDNMGAEGGECSTSGSTMRENGLHPLALQLAVTDDTANREEEEGSAIRKMVDFDGIIKPAYFSVIRDGVHGVKYQKYLFLATFERLTLNKKFNTCVFELAYEMNAIKKWDDVVVFAKDANNGIDEAWFIQSKHMAGCEPPLITYRDLFGGGVNDALVLYNYIRPYSSIMQTFKMKNKVFLFTNRNISSEEIFTSSNNRITVVPKGERTNEILNFGHNGQHVGLTVENSMMDEILQNINSSEITAFSDAILVLFDKKQVKPVLLEYKTTVADVLELTQNLVRFKSSFIKGPNNLELNRLFDELYKKRNNFGMLFLRIEDNGNNQIRSLFSGIRDSSKIFIFIDKKTLQNFFDNLVLCVSQSNDLRSILTDDLLEWLNTSLHPEVLGKLNEGHLSTALKVFKTLFENLNSYPKLKPYLKRTDGEQCLDNIKKQMPDQKKKCLFYVNRQIKFDDGYGSLKITDNEFASQLTNKFKNEKIFFFISEAGAGKTTIFKYMARNVQKIGNTMVYLIHLNEFKPATQHKPLNSFEDAFIALNGIISGEQWQKIKDAVKKNNKRVVIFFDAFDELVSENRNIVIETMKQLVQASNIQIVVSGRGISIKALENKLDVDTFISLVPFNRTDQETFLKLSWKASEYDQTRSHEYVKKLLNLFHATEKNTLHKSIGLPLILEMLAKVQHEDFKEYVLCNKEEITFAFNIADIVDFYDKFIELSLKVELGKSSNIDTNSAWYQSISKDHILHHQLLAIKQLNLPFCSEVLKDPKYASEYKFFSDILEKGDFKSPLLEFIDHDVKFSNKTIAEFLVAKFIYSHHPQLESFFSDLTTSIVFDDITRLYLAFVESKQEDWHIDFLRHKFESRPSIRETLYELCCFNTIKKMLEDRNGVLQLKSAQRTLIEAAYENYYEVCKFMIETYANQLDLRTALTAAAGRGRTEIVQFLIDNGADINSVDSHGNTPVLLAIRRRYYIVAKYLITHNADMFKKNKRGETAAETAITNVRMYRTILEKFGKNYSRAAINRYRKITLKPVQKMMKFVIQRLGNAADCQDLFYHALAEGVDWAAIFLLNRFKNVNIRNNAQKTLLHVATYYNRIEVMKLLLQKKATVDAVDINNDTSLHIAVREGYSDAVKLLLRYKATLNMKNKHNETCYDIAVKMLETDSKDLNTPSLSLEEIQRFENDERTVFRFFSSPLLHSVGDRAIIEDELLPNYACPQESNLVDRNMLLELLPQKKTFGLWIKRKWDFLTKITKNFLILVLCILLVLSATVRSEGQNKLVTRL